MNRFIYTLLWHLLIPGLVLKLWWRGRRAPAYRQRWRERFGGAGSGPLPHHPLWIHAVSVGEVIAILPLVKRLLQQQPDLPILITTMTPTGAERVQAALGSRVCHRYCPYDLPWALRAFLRRSQPRACLIVETELWPNLLHACRQQQIPVILANARLSERSARGYARFAKLTRQMLESLTTVAVQNAQDAERFYALGLAPEKSQITGSIKFDLQLNPEWLQTGAALRQDWGAERPVWIGASTHDPEEKQLLQIHQELLHEFPDLLLILVPRHPERFDAVAEEITRVGLCGHRRSADLPLKREVQVYLGDTMGELMSLYAASDLVFVGGSLIPHGGHNPLEPALLQKPLLCGAHTFNFAEITQGLIEAGGLQACASAKELCAHLRQGLQNPDAAQAAGQAAAHYLAKQSGALARLEALLQPHLNRQANA